MFGLKSIWNIVAAIIAVMAATSCSYPNNNFSSYRTMSDAVWIYGDSLIFLPEHKADSVCRGRFAVGVTHTVNYPYSDLYVELSHMIGPSVHRDTLHLRVADRFGSWLGQGLGDSFQVSDTTAVTIHANGTEVAIRHIMRTDTLRGISQVGIFFLPE